MPLYPHTALEHDETALGSLFTNHQSYSFITFQNVMVILWRLIKFTDTAVCIAVL